MPDFQNRPVKVFIVYARENKDFKERIEKTLLPAVRRGEIDLFTDAQIEFGEDWHQRLSTELARAEIAVFLLSIDYYASEFIHQDEAVTARQRHERGELLILPVVVEECGWRRDPFLSKIQLLPSDGRPIGELKNAAAFAEVAEAIESKALEIREKAAEKALFEQKKGEKAAAEAEKVTLEPTFLESKALPAPPKKETKKPRPEPAKNLSRTRFAEPLVEPISEEKKGFDWPVAGIVAGVLIVAALAFWGLKKGAAVLWEKAKPEVSGVLLPKKDSTSSSIPISKLPPGSMIGTTKTAPKTDTASLNLGNKMGEGQPTYLQKAAAVREIEESLLPLPAGEMRTGPHNDSYAFSDGFISEHEISAQQFWALTGKTRQRDMLIKGDKSAFEIALRAASGKLFHIAGPFEILFAEKTLGRKLSEGGLGFRVYRLK